MIRTSACGTWAAAVMTTVALMGFAKPAWAGQAAAPVVAVWIQNEAHVPAGILTLAQSEVTRVYRHAGVEIDWILDTTVGLVIAVGEDEMADRLNAAACTMGHAIVTVATGRGRRAHVFLGHVEKRIAETRFDRGRILGHVIAHEIGHLLGFAHASSGIMRADWGRGEFALASAGFLLFTPAQGDLIHRRLAGAGPR